MARVSEFRTRPPVPEELPACLDIERLTLGAVIADDTLFGALSSGIDPDEDFSLESHRRIWRCMARQIGRGERIDRVIIAEQLRTFGELESCGGLAYLVDLDTGLPTNPKLDSYIALLKEMAERRRTMRLGEDIRNRAALRCEDLRDIRETGRDSGKSETSKDYRGSSDFIAALDIGFHVTNLGIGLLLDKVVLRAYKHRYGFSGELVYSYCDGRFLRAESSEAEETISDRLTAILRLNPNIGGPQLESLAAQQGVSRTQVRTFLLDGVKSGYVRQSVGSKNAKRYALAGTWGDQNAV